MSMSYYDWLLINEEGTVTTVSARTAAEALLELDHSDYITVVIRQGFSS